MISQFYSYPLAGPILVLALCTATKRQYQKDGVQGSKCRSLLQTELLVIQAEAST